MERLELLNGPPILGRWTIKYDDVFEMPMYIQGALLNDCEDFAAGDNIVLDDILTLDLKASTVSTYSGREFILYGKGKRMILIDEHKFHVPANSDEHNEDYD